MVACYFVACQCEHNQVNSMGNHIEVDISIYIHTCVKYKICLLVVGDGSAGKNDDGEESKGKTVDRVSSQSKSSPFRDLTQKISTGHVLKHSTYRRHTYQYTLKIFIPVLYNSKNLIGQKVFYTCTSDNNDFTCV